MKVKPITSIDTALRIYYMYSEIGNKEMRELFGKTDANVLVRYKNAVREKQTEKGVKTSQLYTVNTAVAYEVWGINVDDLEHRREKLKKLGLLT